MFGVEKLKESLNNFIDHVSDGGKESADSKVFEKIDAKYAAERQGLLSEVAESAVDRIAPFRSKFVDVGKSVAGKKNAEERAGQNEFENITAWSLFVPDFLLKHVTNVIAKNKIFEGLVNHYPLGSKNKTRLLDENGKLKAEPDPDYVINFLRMVHQDIIVGAKSIGKLTGDTRKKPSTTETTPAAETTPTTETTPATA